MLHLKALAIGVPLLAAAIALLWLVVRSPGHALTLILCTILLMAAYCLGRAVLAGFE